MFKDSNLNALSEFNLVKNKDTDGLIPKKSILDKGPKIVVIGGGTGLSTMLRGLKWYTSNITAVVTVADDGGGSGFLRHDLKMLPPGDIRNCILALAHTEPIMEQLLQYRFTEGSLKGQNFGNLFLAAMNGISCSFEEAVKKMSDVLAVTGKVLPVTLEDVKLCALLDNGIKVYGESQIGKKRHLYDAGIEKMYLIPENPKPLPEALHAIKDADLIVIGPGSLYTSIMPNLLVKGIAEAIKSSQASCIYVCNVMTQLGETEGYTAFDHIDAIYSHIGEGLIQYCLVNTQVIPYNMLLKYQEEAARPVIIDRKKFDNANIKLIEKDMLKIYDGYIRHDTQKLAHIIAKFALSLRTNITEADINGVRKKELGNI